MGLASSPTRIWSAKLAVRHVWLPASSHPEYYDTHPEAKKKFALASEAYRLAGKALAAAPENRPAKPSRS